MIYMYVCCTDYEHECRNIYDAYGTYDMESLIIKEEIEELEYLANDVAMTTSQWVVHQQDGGLIINYRYE